MKNISTHHEGHEAHEEKTNLFFLKLRALGNCSCVDLLRYIHVPIRILCGKKSVSQFLS
jgi:hypothetical protein